MYLDSYLIKRPYFKGSFTLITGDRHGSGKSTLAMMLLINSDRNNIVSSEKLQIKHEPFKLENLFDYKGKTIHIAEDFTRNIEFDREVREMMEANWLGFITGLEENNNRLIVEIQSERFLLPSIQNTFDILLFTHQNRERKTIEVKFWNFKEKIQDHFLVIQVPGRYYRYLPKYTQEDLLGTTSL